MSAVKIAAIVPSVGASAWAGELLDSIRRELATRDDARVIWVQQGPAPAPALSGANETLLRLARPAGFAAAVNAGHAEAGDAQLVAVLNDDVVLEPGWFAMLEAELSARPGVAAVQGVVLDLHRPDRIDGCGIGWNADWQAVQLLHGEPTSAAGTRAVEVFGVSATAAIYRNVALHAVARANAPFFAERLESYYEDVELAVRLRETAHSALLVPAARARHAGQATTARAPRDRWRRIYRNRRWVLERLLGEQFLGELRRIEHRDRRDFVRRLLSFDFAAAAGIRDGLREARRGNPLAPAFDAGRALAAALTVSSPA